MISAKWLPLKTYKNWTNLATTVMPHKHKNKSKSKSQKMSIKNKFSSNTITQNLRLKRKCSPWARKKDKRLVILSIKPQLHLDPETFNGLIITESRNSKDILIPPNHGLTFVKMEGKLRLPLLQKKSQF